MASNAAGWVQSAASSAAIGRTPLQRGDSQARLPRRPPPCSRHRRDRPADPGQPPGRRLIAFGVGWLVSSLLPATEKEKQLAQQAETAISENKDALLEPAKQAAQEIGEQLKPAAQQAVESVKATAQDAADHRGRRGQVRRGGRAGQGPAGQDDGPEPGDHLLTPRLC